MLFIDLKRQSFRVQTNVFAEHISTHDANFCFLFQLTLQVGHVGCRVPGGPKLDDLFVTTVKTFWQVWLDPMHRRFALDFAAHAAC